jgi:hypothetical protein
MSKCKQCNKKLGVMEFTCRCKNTYCITHLPYEEHNCTYDFKGDLKKQLNKTLNVGVLREKVDKI